MSSASLTPTALSVDRKPAIVHLASPFAPSRSPYHSINTDSVGTHNSLYPVSRVNHLRPYGSSVSTSSRSEWASIDERRTHKQKACARNARIRRAASRPSGMRSGFCRCTLAVQTMPLEAMRFTQSGEMESKTCLRGECFLHTD